MNSNYIRHYTAIEDDIAHQFSYFACAFRFRRCPETSRTSCHHRRPRSLQHGDAVGDWEKMMASLEAMAVASVLHAFAYCISPEQLLRIICRIKVWIVIIVSSWWWYLTPWEISCALLRCSSHSRNAFWTCHHVWTTSTTSKAGKAGQPFV